MIVRLFCFLFALFSINAAYGSCYETTKCRNGRRISCSVFGNNCFSYTQPGKYVRCVGKNDFGQTADESVYCSDYEDQEYFEDLERLLKVHSRR